MLTSESRQRLCGPNELVTEPQRPKILHYETPPTPCVIQNSIRRTTPDIPSNIAAPRSHRPKVRPDMKAITAPKTAPPAPIGAMTLQIQSTKFRQAPSGCAPV